MSLQLISVLVILTLTAGYVLYGRFIARQYGLDAAVVTPAVDKNDGLDFVPTRPFYLLGQHFSAIAAAGPIVGPIAACLVFGWVPCLLWIVLGVILIGAVHDFSALVASVRHGAHSIAEITRQNVSHRAWLVLTAFIWLALVYVIVAFTDVTAETFLGQAEELAGSFTFNKGGAVAAASTMYLALALVMGLVQKKWNPPMSVMTAVFVPATLGVVWLGTKVSTVLVYDIGTWRAAILVYCFVASMLPLWLLQQSRGYLGGFVLYLAIGAGVVGIFFGGFQIQQPAFKTPVAFADGLASGGNFQALLFPFLFVTIACGACSGFHGLVCGGTTSKQIEKEPDCQAVGFGAMLLEGFVAVIALATIMIVAPGDIAGRGPGKLYGDGIAQFLTVVLGKDAFVFCATFGAMAFSTFVFDTLDVATRLGRYLLQELLRTGNKAAGLAATAATVGLPFLILFSGGQGAWRKFWVLFGTSNQLLASFTLIVITVWLYRTGRRYWYTLVPMLFILIVTVAALKIQAYVGFLAVRKDGLSFTPAVMNGFVALAMLGLAAVFIAEAIFAVIRAKNQPLHPHPGSHFKIEPQLAPEK